MTHYLIIGRNYVGDAIMSQPLIRALKINNPICKVTVIAGGAGFLTYQTMQEVDEVIYFNWKKKSLQLKECYHFAQTLKNNYDVAITLNNSIKSTLIPFFLKIPQRLGYLGEMRYGLLTNYLKNIPKKQIKELPIIDYYYRLLSLLPVLNVENSLLVPQLNASFIEEKVEKKNEEHTFNVSDYPFINNVFLAIAPGAATSEAKKYPVTQFIEFIKKFNQKYPNIPIVLLGSKDDLLLGETIENLVSSTNLINLINKIPLIAAFHIIAKSVAIIANDSGLLHVAGSLNKPCLGIYGPTGVAFASPRNKDFIAIENVDLQCRPCYKGTCLFSETSSDYLKCMLSLTPDLLLQHLDFETI